jgi:hypothetical protein
MTGTSEIDRRLTRMRDQPAHMGVNERLSRTSTPVTQQAGLDVVDTQRAPEKGIVLQINLINRQVVAGPSPCIEGGQLVGPELAEIIPIQIGHGKSLPRIGPSQRPMVHRPRPVVAEAVTECGDDAPAL